MKTSVKWLTGSVGVLLLLALLGAGAVLALLDPERVRDELVEIVKAQTGRDLQIEQPVELSLFPWLGVSLRAVSLGNDPRFGPEPLARAEQLRVRVRVLPLLAGWLELDRLVLDGLALNLARNAQGEANWRTLAARPEPVPGAATAPHGLATERVLAPFLLGGVELTRGRIAWHDAQAGRRYLLEDLSLRTGAVTAGLAVPVRLAGRLQLERPRRELGLTATGTVSLDDAFRVVATPDLVLGVEAEGEGLPAEGVAVEARAGLQYDSARQTLEIAPLELVGPALRLTGRLSASALAGAPVLDGQVDVAEARPRELLPLLGVDAPRTTDPAAFGRASGGLPFRVDGEAAVFDRLTQTLDDTTLNGTLTVTDLAAPAVRFELAADRLDLDRYLPPPRGATSAPAAEAGDARPARPEAAGAVIAAGAALPVEPLRRLDLAGSLRADTLKVGGARLADVRTTWRAQGGLVTQTAEARLYGGSGRTTSTLDARPAQPALGVTGSLKDVDLGALLADTTGGGRLAGTGTVDADLRWVGLDETQLRRTLNGSLRLAVRDGAVRGFDLDALVRDALAAARGDAAGGGSAQTDVAELTASATVRNGVPTNRDLRARSSLLQVTGEGTIDLPANRIDYRAMATVVKGAQDRLGVRVKELEDAVVPVRFTGSLDEPTIRLDVDAVLKDQAWRQIERKVEEKLKGEWGDQLRKFFER